MFPYRCPQDNGFHIGHSPRKARRRDAAMSKEK
jgi:hypothetical protein